MSQNAAFAQWTASRALHAIGTNHKSAPIPFQSWKNFKEAFAPELIFRAIDESELDVDRILDPFGGSGTTSLAAQFLGVHPVTCEVNPFLADLIEAKLTNYEISSLRSDIDVILRRIEVLRHEVAGWEPAAHTRRWLPPTFVEPGHNERWLFSKKLNWFIEQVLEEATELVDDKNARLVKVIIGGVLVDLSNARVSGKGRRYRNSWKERETSTDRAASVMSDALRDALSDVCNHNARACLTYELIRGDARKTMGSIEAVDLCVFSPPYPNSFDYTDVYNIELWMLGYLKDMKENRSLRSATISSHVQISRDYSPAPKESPLLKMTLERLEQSSQHLWSPHIPAMIGAYFAEMDAILRSTLGVLRPKGQSWLVVGDSRYANVDVPVALILEELATAMGYLLIRQEPFRSMRASPQQGGAMELAETLLVLQRP
ncbi:DNA methyltransferase [Clavibacter sp. CFBP 8614]|uniref:DNA methyltransferase n=1 Tax=unclassified Clavibacter TaxID=2626594 RepID=UPI004042AB51